MSKKVDCDQITGLKTVRDFDYLYSKKIVDSYLNELWLHDDSSNTAYIHETVAGAGGTLGFVLALGGRILRIIRRRRHLPLSTSLREADSLVPSS